MCKDFGTAFSELAHGKTPVQEAEDANMRNCHTCHGKYDCLVSIIISQKHICCLVSTHLRGYVPPIEHGQQYGHESRQLTQQHWRWAIPNERSYLRYYGLLGQRFCMMQRKYQNAFDEVFQTQYQSVHRLETNKLRNVAKFFAHLLGK